MSPGKRFDMGQEISRKAFHLLGFIYIALFHWLGVPRILWWFGAWVILVGLVERLRMKYPALNQFLWGLFSKIAREKEFHRVSGIFWGSLGCWCTFWLFGSREYIVDAALLYFILGDLSAAIAGKSLGRLRFRALGETKSLEGSLACFFVCCAIGWTLQLPFALIWAGAFAAMILEGLSLPPDDNFWIPVGCATLLYWMS